MNKQNSASEVDYASEIAGVKKKSSIPDILRVHKTDERKKTGPHWLPTTRKAHDSGKCFGRKPRLNPSAVGTKSMRSEEASRH